MKSLSEAVNRKLKFESVRVKSETNTDGEEFSLGDEYLIVSKEKGHTIALGELSIDNSLEHIYRMVGKVSEAKEVPFQVVLDVLFTKHVLSTVGEECIGNCRECHGNDKSKN